MPPGYYRYPTIHNDNVVFVSEDDLWTIPVTGGIARRLTSNVGEVSYPALSPDGTQLAFIGREEDQAEVYLMPALGGAAHRLTFMGGSVCISTRWTPDGQIVFANNAGHWYLRFTHLYSVDTSGNSPQQLSYGLARAIAFGPKGGVLLGRHTDDPARWKRYRGGTAGQLWIDVNEQGNFRPLFPGLGNLSSPMWLNGLAEQSRVYFISDHEGVGNLYSCLPSGEDLRRHTRYEDYYIRNASTDGKRIVYHAGADLYLYDPSTNQVNGIPVEYHSPRVQRNRKFVDASRYLGSWSIHPQGQALAITARGKLFSFANWEGAVIQHQETEMPPTEDRLSTGIRYRLPDWLPDGKRLVAISDAGGEEKFVLFNTTDPNSQSLLLPTLDIGRPETLSANPKKDQILFSNNRYELFFLDLQTHELRLIDRGRDSPIAGAAWSPDGEWVAYSVSTSLQTAVLKIWNSSSGEITLLTRPVLRDVAPAFDPQGKYLYFLSYRSFDPVFDSLQFELSFPRGMKPYLITLQKELPSPFIPRARLGESSGEKKETTGEAETQVAKVEFETKQKTEETDEIKPLRIDLEGIQDRLIAFPVSEGLYGRILGIAGDKVLYSHYPVEGALERPVFQTEPEPNGTLLVYNFEDQKEESLIGGITSFDVSSNGKVLVYRSANRLRVLKAGEKPQSESNSYTRKSGWIDLSRGKVSIIPGEEWRQMYREAWRLQRDQFWTADMSLVDWEAIHNRYLPLVDRVGSRAEFSDLMWEMQGELGTSHAYEFGGDYRPEPRYAQGYLGANFEYDPETDGWRIVHIYKGDAWNPEADSPLSQPGVDVKVSETLIAINNQRLSRSFTPAMALVNLADEEVTLTILPGTAGQTSQIPAESYRSVIVRTLRSEVPVRYREWVEANRKYVHQASQGRIGYLHIPDMGPAGFAEFHRGFLLEVTRDGLIVDVRFNRGGNVSELLLEKLSRRRIGYSTSRWQQEPTPYPTYTVAGPMVALTNENAGSDGDIFSHGFKLMKLGPLIGKRTWGGVIGIEPRHNLVDGTLTTQPEYSFWFTDVGWKVENYGTDPDIEIDILPQDYAQGADPQLERAIFEAIQRLEANPPAMPDFTKKPGKAAPRLPKG